MDDRAWIDPHDLTALWRLAGSEAQLPQPESVCEAGWKRGCLAKTTKEGKSFYSSAGTEDAAAPGDFLDARDSKAVGIDLRLIPSAALERIARASSMEIHDGRLMAAPDLVRMGRAPEEDRQQTEFSWLGERHLAFQGAFTTLRQRQGKTIVHENLLIARVRNLSLKVMIEKKFLRAGQVVSLSDEFIAFPRGLFRDIQSLIRKKGHVVKIVNSHARD